MIGNTDSFSLEEYRRGRNYDQAKIPAGYRESVISYQG